jgi:hypothetical protein
MDLDLNQKISHDPFRSSSVTSMPKSSLLLGSVCAHRVNREDTNFIGSRLKITDTSRLINFVTPEDHVRVEAIKKYFTKKNSLRVLSGSPQYKFHEDMNYVLTAPETEMINSKYFGLIYSLPFFYDYDTQIDALFQEYESSVDSLAKLGTSKLDIVPVVRTKLPSASRHVFEYWFKTGPELKQLIKIPVTKDNTFRLMMDDIVNNKKNLNITVTANSQFNRSQREAFLIVNKFNINSVN